MHTYDENKIRGKLIIEKPVAQVFLFLFVSEKYPNKTEKKKGKRNKSSWIQYSTREGVCLFFSFLLAQEEKKQVFQKEML